jgi:hypothetical protein
MKKDAAQGRELTIQQRSVRATRVGDGRAGSLTASEPSIASSNSDLDMAQFVL